MRIVRSFWWTAGGIDISQSRFPRSQVAQDTAPAQTDVLVPHNKDILAKVSDDPVKCVESQRPRGYPAIAVERDVHALPNPLTGSNKITEVLSADAVHQQDEAHFPMFGEGRVQLVRQIYFGRRVLNEQLSR